jgi:perosamine synthetase
MSQDDHIALSDPDIGHHELATVLRSLGAPRLSGGPLVEDFEAAFARWTGRRHAVAVASGTLGTWLALRALGIGPGDEVVIARPTAGTRWRMPSRCVAPRRPLPTSTTGRAAWTRTRGRADRRRAPRRCWWATSTATRPPGASLRRWPTARPALIEDSTEAWARATSAACVGSFGGVAVFDFSQPRRCAAARAACSSPTTPRWPPNCATCAAPLDDRLSVSVGAACRCRPASASVTAALGMAQLERIDEILARRKRVEVHYHAQMQSFEGIKPPYLAPDVDEVHWMLYVVHLGKRFTASARAQLVDDLATECIEAAAYCKPLHQQFHYRQLGWKRGQLPQCRTHRRPCAGAAAARPPRHRPRAPSSSRRSRTRRSTSAPAPRSTVSPSERHP